MYVLHDIKRYESTIDEGNKAMESQLLHRNNDALHSLLLPMPIDPSTINTKQPIAAMTRRYTLWIIQNGSAWLTLERQPKIRITGGQCVLLEPDCHYTIEDAEEEISSCSQLEKCTDSELYRQEANSTRSTSANGSQKQSFSWLEITFDYMGEMELQDDRIKQTAYTNPSHTRERRWMTTRAPFACTGVLSIRQSREVQRLALRLFMLRTEMEQQTASKESSTNGFNHQGNMEAVLFQHMIHELLCVQPEAAAKPLPDSDTHLEQTIAYMEQYYGQTITRNKLASIARLSPWYYSTSFQQRYGMSPMTYLNEVRLRRAKEQLVIGKLPVRDIADQCGFRDESYFRRRFKTSVGVTPLHFAGQKRERVADMSYAYVPHLLALQVAPYAAMVNEERDVHRRPYHASITVPLPRQRQMTEALWEHNMKLLASADPSVILCDDGKERMPYRQQLEQIAPCLYVPWKQLDWRSQLRQVAEYVHHESTASLWLERYEQSIYAVRQQLERTVAGDSTMLLRITGEQLAVYGRRNVGAVLYDDLQLHCPYDIDTIEVERIIELDFVEQYDPHHLLLVIDQEPISIAHWERIRQDERWLELTAVRTGQVHRLSEMPWLEYSPLAHQWIAERLPSILQSSYPS